MSDRESKVSGAQSRPGSRWSPGIAPTGSELTSEGSSVETDSDVATSEDIPDAEEIIARAERRAEGAELPDRHPAGPHVPSNSAVGGVKTLTEADERERREERKPRAMEEEGAWEEAP